MPTRTRHIVVFSAMALSWLTFLDRAAIGQAAPLITRDLGLSSVQMGYVFSAFGLAYALFEIPAGLNSNSIVGKDRLKVLQFGPCRSGIRLLKLSGSGMPQSSISEMRRAIPRRSQKTVERSLASDGVRSR
jgi:MFS family permease